MHYANCGRFDSELAWDSTGQEGVYAWSKYFNDTTTATNTLNSILAYQPTVPHWGYNGNARRYWSEKVFITCSVYLTDSLQGQYLWGQTHAI